MYISFQDIPENGADVAHLTYLHHAGVASGSDMNFRDLLVGKILTHNWTAKWESLPEPLSYIGRMTLTMTNKIFGVPFRALDITSVADQVIIFFYAVLEILALDNYTPTICLQSVVLQDDSLFRLLCTLKPHEGHPSVPTCTY